MKTYFLSLTALVISLVSSVSCSKFIGSDIYYHESATDGSVGGNGSAGIVTAGEWNDLDHWNFWGVLNNSNDFSKMSAYWGFNTEYRVAVKVVDNNGKPVAGAKIALTTGNGGKPLWETVTDNHGLAECFPVLFGNTVEPDQLLISINGELQRKRPVPIELPKEVAPEYLEALTDSALINVYTFSTPVTSSKSADIAFIVDATGSMGDEISFLKEDLLDIIKKASQNTPVSMRTAALFYRDVEDEYITKYSNFNTNPEATLDFIRMQDANGGGDYPEAVHTALEKTLQDLSWKEDATTKLAFLLLDAPAHHNENVLESLHRSIRLFAGKGIKLIPIAASGADDNTEFMLRFFAISTGGTYVFITDHSGVGNEHNVPKVGKYEVEQLNELIVRLIKHYTE